jgi:hypothetical protein
MERGAIDDSSGGPRRGQAWAGGQAPTSYLLE